LSRYLRQNLQKNRSELQIPRHSAEAEPGTTFYARAVSFKLSRNLLSLNSLLA